jgi:hypothetical protein
VGSVFNLYCGVSLTPPLNETSWADISAASAEGTASSYWAVGDTKAVDIKGTVGTVVLDTTLYVYIIDFDHNSELEGKGISFGTFKTKSGVDVCLVDGYYDVGNYPSAEDGTKAFNINHYGTSSSTDYGVIYGGWKGSDLRYDILGSTDIAPSGYGALKDSSNEGYDATIGTATNPVPGTLMAALPSDLRAVMKPIIKYTDNSGKSSGTEEAITASIDFLPLLSEYEGMGKKGFANEDESKYQTQYTYYAVGNSMDKYACDGTQDLEDSDAHSENVDYWSRSVWRFDDSYFVTFSDTPFAGNSAGLAPVFLV